MVILKDYNKYENYIRIGHNGSGSKGNYTCSDLQPFPTPSNGFKRKLHDVDVDAYTDLKGYTHRNRVRHDVEDITLSYSILSPADEAYILNRISPTWVYVELIDKKTRQKKVHKMYASDKEWDVYHVVYKNGEWVEVATQFSFSLVEE